MERYSRNERLIGPEGQARLCSASVAVFGLGGVGSFAAEALARAGVGRLLLIDGDCAEESNVNRQLAADYSTLGRPKAEVMRERALLVNPDCRAEAYRLFYDADTADEVDLNGCDCVIDAVDTVSSKLLIVERARAAGAWAVSAMGAGNKLDPTRFEAADIYETSVCPLARVMRRELRARGVPELRVVYSREEPAGNARPPGSISFVPSVAGLILAGEAIRHILMTNTPEGAKDR